MLLLLVPYVMANCWAMSFVPYLLVRDLVPESAPTGTVVVTLLLLPATYFVAGAVIITLGRWLGWLPR